jgi:GPI mannosyltransferase 3
MVLGGRLHPDEIHQYLEPAHRYIWGYGTIPHEWHSGMRNVVAPGVIAGIFSLARTLGIQSSAVYLGLVHCIVGALSLTVISWCYDAVLARSDPQRASMAAWILALWVPWENLCFRTLGETFSTIALVAALRTFERPIPNHLLVGFWLGTAFVFRYPSALFAVPFAIAYVLRRDGKGFLQWIVGGCIALTLLGIADTFTWGKPFHSVFAYADYNLFRDRARIDFGQRPFWFYGLCFFGFTPIAMFAFVRRGLRIQSMPLAVAITYLLGMSLIAHKEPRFFLPMIPCLVVVAAAWLPEQPRKQYMVVVLCVVHSLISLAIYQRSGVCEGNVLRATQWIATQPTITSVTLVGVSHPGYVTLHRNVAIVGDAHNDIPRMLHWLDVRAPLHPTDYVVVRGDHAYVHLTQHGWITQCCFSEVCVMSGPR